MSYTDSELISKVLQSCTMCVCVYIYVCVINLIRSQALFPRMHSSFALVLYSLPWRKNRGFIREATQQDVSRFTRMCCTFFGTFCKCCSCSHVSFRSKYSWAFPLAISKIHFTLYKLLLVHCVYKHLQWITTFLKTIKVKLDEKLYKHV